MICPNCGKEIADTSKFCIQCGSRLEESPPAAPALSPAPAAGAEELHATRPKAITPVSKHAMNFFIIISLLN